MNEVSTGMKTLVDAAPGSIHNSFYTGIGGRFYYYVAPQKATFPYAVHWYPNEANDPYLSEDHEEILVQLDVFSQNSDSAECGTLVGYAKSLFDNVILTVSGYTAVPMTREFVIPSVWDMDIEAWKSTIQYRLHLIKS